ncbi:YcjX family GTP-binding protein [Zobellella maritima]|uniref:YcjX family protein n=1 Tax=Zobellella maritima TaxID=2059725 RepID=UPI000E300278|nr:YcjX family protein [Zobellella maritima]
MSKATLEQWRHKAGAWVQRGLDQRLRLAVTGLSRSGKTAFITSLVNQLEHAGLDARLPHWEPAAEGRLLGIKRVPQRHHHIPAFGYEAALSQLSAAPPRWPEPTKGISEITLAIKYRPRSRFKRQLNDSATLYLEIVDYPGEWLLDLPLLSQSYAQWSRQQQALVNETALGGLAEEWRRLGADIAPDSPADDTRIAPLAESYTRWLHAIKQQAGAYLVQPGRFVLPGEYQGAPMLQFVPWIWGEVPDGLNEGHHYGMMAARFEHYKKYLVQGFYREYFAGFDRQIVLVDCLTPLNQGAASFDDLKRALTAILLSFQYGKSRWWHRLFSPRIDKLLFAATKADHLTPEQHGKLSRLLETLVKGGHKHARLAGIDIHTLALAAVKATRSGQVAYQGEQLPALQGVRLADGEPVTLYPGDVPEHLPGPEFWRQQGFDFTEFAPPDWHKEVPLPHLRLDQALAFLLGDKLL